MNAGTTHLEHHEPDVHGVPLQVRVGPKAEPVSKGAPESGHFPAKIPFPLPTFKVPP